MIIEIFGVIIFLIITFFCVLDDLEHELKGEEVKFPFIAMVFPLAIVISIICTIIESIK